MAQVDTGPPEAVTVAALGAPYKSANSPEIEGISYAMSQ